MGSRQVWLSLLAASLWLWAAPATPVAARGALTLNQDVCLLFIGPDYMYFSGYRPDKPRKRFCEEAPEIGESVFAMDFAQSEMRDMKVDFRIMRDIGDTDEPAAIEGATLSYLPPKAYPGGSLSLHYNFVEPGAYAGVVTAQGSHGEHWVARFPFTVGQSYMVKLPYFLLAAAVGVGAFLLLRERAEHKKPPPNGKRG